MTPVSQCPLWSLSKDYDTRCKRLVTTIVDNKHQNIKDCSQGRDHLQKTRGTWCSSCVNSKKYEQVISSTLISFGKFSNFYFFSVKKSKRYCFSFQKPSLIMSTWSIFVQTTLGSKLVSLDWSFLLCVGIEANTLPSLTSSSVKIMTDPFLNCSSSLL